MSTDICFPKNNELEFIKKAEKIGISNLIFVYLYKKDVLDYKEKMKELQMKTRINLMLSLIADDKDIQKAKNISNLIIARSSEKNHQVLETFKPDLICGLENSNKKDKMHYRYSSLNQVLCKICNKNKIIVGFSFSTLLNSSPKNKVIILGRIMQNILFCRKYKISVFIGSFAENPFKLRYSRDLSSLLKVLGASDMQIKESQNSVMNKIKQNTQKRDKNYISEDITLVE